MKRVTTEQAQADFDGVLDAAEVAPVLIVKPTGERAVLMSTAHYEALINELKAYGVEVKA